MVREVKQFAVSQVGCFSADPSPHVNINSDPVQKLRTRLDLPERVLGSTREAQKLEKGRLSAKRSSMKDLFEDERQTNNRGAKRSPSRDGSFNRLAAQPNELFQDAILQGYETCNIWLERKDAM